MEEKEYNIDFCLAFADYKINDNIQLDWIYFINKTTAYTCRKW